MNPVIYSAKLDKECSVDVPYIGKCVLVHFSVEEGDLQVYFDSLNNNPSLKLYPNARWNQRINPEEVTILYLKKYSTKNFVVWITMEKLS